VSRYIVNRRDENEPVIVDAIEKAGIGVYKKMPCDLLCRVPTDPPGMLRAIEIKTPQGKSQKLRLRKDQKDQAEFCSQTGVPYVTTIAEAFKALDIVIGDQS
jgi:hypothetical protein